MTLILSFGIYPFDMRGEEGAFRHLSALPAVVFGDEAYLNMELGYLFRSGQADADLKQKRRQEEAAAAPPPKETEEGCSGILRRIRRANDAIADEALSAKIDRLETITAKIFRAVEEDPKKRDRIDTFLNYYLPTTLKLLNAYDRMSSQGVEGQNISGTMERVESMMSNIVTAFERQLDSLFGDQALDISTDITVLENMMAREGLSDDPIHQTREETPAAEERESGEDGDGIQLEL